MKQNIERKPTSFFITAPLPCPYLSNRVEQRMVTELSGSDPITLHETLSQAGFRRSHSLVYTPMCKDCSACIPVRTVVNKFQPSTSQRRILKLNKNITAEEMPARATSEQFELFSRYQEKRHTGGDMSSMDFYDFQALIEETPVITVHINFRNEHDFLIGGCLVDIMSDGLSAVYSYFDPNYHKNSIGSYMVLWLIERTKQLGLPHLYLGYWIKGSKKMAYKDKFSPLEYYAAEAWSKFDKKKFASVTP
jgi:arginyl-tRNA--protein-N-Asp/Glu arginylyltransferase